MCQRSDAGPQSETTAVGFSLSLSLFSECSSAFTLRMFVLKACCQKAGGSEVEALCGGEVS